MAGARVADYYTYDAEKQSINDMARHFKKIMKECGSLPASSRIFIYNELCDLIILSMQIHIDSRHMRQFISMVKDESE